MEKKRRFYDIDLLKAVSIIAVIGVHSISTSFSDGSGAGRFLGDLTAFAVPGLLFASGFLFDKTGTKSGTLIKKLLVRIFPPYIFWSMVIMVFKLPGGSQGADALDLKTMVFNLLFGHVVGIYYFVFVITYLYGISFFLKRLSRRGVLLLWGVLVVITLVFVKNIFFFVPVPERWFMLVLMRHPLVHLLPYLSGWVFFLYRESVIERVSSSWIRVGGPVILIDGILLLSNQPLAPGALTRLILQGHIYLAIFFILWAGSYRLKPVRPIYFLSRISYGLFLLHFPFVRAFQGFFPEETSAFSILYSSLALASGLGGSLFVIYLGKRLLGRYSVYIIGA